MVTTYRTLQSSINKGGIIIWTQEYHMEAEIKKCKELGAEKSVEQKQLEGALGIRGS